VLCSLSHREKGRKTYPRKQGGQESSPLPLAEWVLSWRSCPSSGRKKSGLKGENNLESPALKYRRAFLHERHDAFAEILCFAAGGDLMRFVCHLGFKGFVEAGIA
jgi:hypothetical protein